MTTNHPANGPVSLDRLHHIREILSKAAAQSDGGNLGYAMADAVKVIDGAIAAFDAEPVAWTEKCEITNMQATGLYLRGFPDNSQGRDIALYTAPPAPVLPVVSDELLSAMEEVLRISDRDHEAWHKARNGIASCRVATLQSGNSPVSPDGWIPVSERMPEKADEVLCAKEFDGPGDWRQKVGYYLVGKWTVYGASWTPTHWMPLPAAPQQEE